MSNESFQPTHTHPFPSSAPSFLRTDHHYLNSLHMFPCQPCFLAAKYSLSCLCSPPHSLTHSSLSLPITSYRQQPHTCHPATMFRHLCFLAVAFLAVSDATNHPKHIKDSKPCGNKGSKKTKTASFCVAELTGFIDPPPPGGAILTTTQGILFDCDNTVSGHWGWDFGLVSFLLYFIIVLVE